ncbi:hypothetical protein E2C01_027950 [Portunus trituberculatus]|uniref:Uncharacterized protein n=1 Tax=Portunus trituberculatus TaxID=210409 RepID=A0A5B7EMQ7_PORTR|nr:hypothetical protein [Portunus trituberculatus]
MAQFPLEVRGRQHSSSSSLARLSPPQHGHLPHPSPLPPKSRRMIPCFSTSTRIFGILGYPNCFCVCGEVGARHDPQLRSGVQASSWGLSMSSGGRATQTISYQFIVSTLSVASTGAVSR